jgi:hypothetical protein
MRHENDIWDFHDPRDQAARRRLAISFLTLKRVGASLKESGVSQGFCGSVQRSYGRCGTWHCANELTTTEDAELGIES